MFFGVVDLEMFQLIAVEKVMKANFISIYMYFNYIS